MKHHIGRISNFKLILAQGDELDEFRCSVCGNLLLKGKNLDKAVIEVRCKKCGTLAVNPK